MEGSLTKFVDHSAYLVTKNWGTSHSVMAHWPEVSKVDICPTQATTADGQLYLYDPDRKVKGDHLSYHRTQVSLESVGVKGGFDWTEK